MFNFLKKPGNTQADVQKQTTGLSLAYNDAIKKIELLEHELNRSLQAQQIMSESVKNCTATLYAIRNQLTSFAAHLDFSRKLIIELTQDNKVLKSSNEHWLNRAIKLEFEILTTKDELNNIENKYESVVKMCEHLRLELMSVEKEKSQNEHQN